MSGGYAEAAPDTIIAGAGGLQPVFLAECSGSLALSLPAPVDAHYDVTLLAARPGHGRSAQGSLALCAPWQTKASPVQDSVSGQQRARLCAGPSLTGLGWRRQAETFFTAPQQRVFDVLFQGQAVLHRVDLVALVGARTAWQHTVSRFPVAGGRLNITFINIVRLPHASRAHMGSALAQAPAVRRYWLSVLHACTCRREL